MATFASVPAGGITLHGVSNESYDLKKGAASAILLELSASQVQDFRKAAQVKDGLQLVTGTFPKLRIGGRTIELSLAPDAFRNELYASTVAGSLADLAFSGLVSHRAELKAHDHKSSDDTAGSDAALAALKSTMASLEQEKQANHTNIVSSVLPTPRNRFEAARKSRPSLLGTDPGSPALGASPALRPPTSEPISKSEVRLRALRTPVLHLLAIQPTPTSHIVQTTHIPKDDVEKILPKIARQEEGGTWKLIDRAYKDLDIWSFSYTSEKDRQAAIDNAVRAFDRQRLGKEEKIWQQLLPKEDRGKGIVLSRLGAGQGQRGLTPMPASSPMPAEADGQAVSAANTPRIGAATPKPASSRGDVMKRLLSKDPKKRAEEAAKEQKRKERAAAREAAASEPKAERPAKKQTAKKENPTIKSAEFVHSSDDESGEEGEVRDEITRVDSKVSPERPISAAQHDRSSGSSTSPNSSDETSKSRTAAVKHGSKARSTPDPAKSIASLASKTARPAAAATAGKVTPRTTNGLSAPNSQHKSQRSPQKNSRPNVPSPLGAARPRLASDVSDRTAVGVQRSMQGAGTPRGLGITSSSGRKRHNTVTSSASSEGDKKQNGEALATKSAVSGSGKLRAPMTNGVSRKAEGGVKRKAEDSPAQVHPKASKHRKTAASPPYNHSSAVLQTSTARTSPDNSSSSSENSVLETITFTQGISVAEKFTVYYPAYAKMYDELAAKEAKGEKVGAEEKERLWAMHRRLEQMKREIAVASRREHGEE